MLPWLTVAFAADVRGITLSTHTWGEEWGGDAMPATLDAVAALGANWVTTHPYARIDADGTVRFRPIDPGNPPEWLARPIREAHARGMKVMVTPHLAYWGSPFAWRGAITFQDEASWQRFFASYERWIVMLAQATHEADAFVVGSELDGTAGREREWRKAIASVRVVFPGALTYASNWDRFAEVRFWDALDAIGIQAYFPLSTAPDPEVADLRLGWAQWRVRLQALHQRTGKYIVFTELGYDDGPLVAAEPWANGTGYPERQRLCLEEALRAVDEMPFVVGAFLWKWFPGSTGSGDFDVSRADLRAAVARRWSVR